jgi:hypothetical protein
VVVERWIYTVDFGFGARRRKVYGGSTMEMENGGTCTIWNIWGKGKAGRRFLYKGFFGMANGIDTKQFTSTLGLLIDFVFGL